MKKNFNQSTFIALFVSVASVGLMVACGGGGGGGGGYVYTGSQPIDDFTNVIYTGSSGTTGSGGSTGSGGWTGSSGSSSGDTGGCDASGCNSFGTGGTKNTGLLAAQMTQAQMQNRATAVASQFQMSFDAAYKLTKLANQVQLMKQQGQMTAADKTAIIESAFSVAGVTSDEVNNAIAKSVTGDNSDVEAVMSKAAINMGMPSGATFRDKVLPLFTGNNQ